jgi:hypothetical protein
MLPDPSVLSFGARGRHRTARSWRRRLAVAALAAAALIAGSLAVPAVANASSRTTTVRGSVTLSGHPLAKTPVGAWSTTRGVLATAKTNSHGRFTLHIPRGVAVYAYAGSAPSTSKAVFALGSRHLVRGVIGAHAPAKLAGALSEALAAATPSKLGGGHALHFRLQRAGRFTGQSSELGSFVDTTGSILIERGSGTYSDPIQAGASGSFTSPWLVPGRYHLFWDPKPTVLPARSWTTVRSGATTHVADPLFVAGATITIDVVDAAGDPVTDAVPVVQTLADGTQDGTLGTTQNGQVVLTDQAAGTLRFTVGRYFDDPDEGLGEDQTQPTSENWLPVSASVTVDSNHDAATVRVQLTPAAHLTGTVAAANGSDVRSVVAENSEGVPVRGKFLSGDDNAFDLGGLPAGTYRVFAIESHADGTDAVYAASTAVTVAADGSQAVGLLTPATAESTLSGTVKHATSGSVAVGVPYAYVAEGDIGASGRYQLSSIPGTFPITADAAYHFTGEDGTVTIGTTAVTKTVQLGPAFASAEAHFTVHGRPEKVEVGAVNGVFADAFALEPTGSKGKSTAKDLVPSRYRWAGTPYTLLAADGPWYYSAPTGSFTLKAGKLTNLGTKRLVILH